MMNLHLLSLACPAGRVGRGHHPGIFPGFELSEVLCQHLLRHGAKHLRCGRVRGYRLTGGTLAFLEGMKTRIIRETEMDFVNPCAQCFL